VILNLGKLYSCSKFPTEILKHICRRYLLFPKTYAAAVVSSVDNVKQEGSCSKSDNATVPNNSMSDDEAINIKLNGHTLVPLEYVNEKI
jgi:hypothetical protein